MQKSKTCITLIVILLILTVPFSQVSADSIPPGHQYPLGDLQPEAIDGFTPLAADFVPSGFSADLAANPNPIAPKSNNVFTKTPKFYFSILPGASQYHLQVIDTVASPDLLVYDYYGTGKCTTTYCVLQPDFELKTFRYHALKGGQYEWVVEGMVGGVWKGFTAPATFAVLSTGFNSTFDASASKWLGIYGSWTRTTAGYYKTQGTIGYLNSALQTETFANDYVYEVKMKRKVEADTFNRIIFHGDPNTLSTAKNWNTGYYFGYYNNGTWGLWRVDSIGSSVLLYNGVPSSYINKFGWNTLTVWTDYPYIHMWINGAYIGYVPDSTYGYGFVGVGVWENDSSSSPLLIDTARLYYSATPPLAITDAVLDAPSNITVIDPE